MSLCVNMYVINVQGLASKAESDAGTEKISRAFIATAWSLSRKPIPAIIVIRTNTPILI